MGRLKRAASDATHGKRRWQRFWHAAHEQSLLGLNYGRGGVHNSGEQFALTYAHEQAPDARVMIDVGANIGDWSLAARGLWPNAAIHAFEPSAGSYRRLLQATENRGIKCVLAACGETEGKATLYAVPGLSELSSLHERDLSAHHMEMTETETVRVTRIDKYCAEKGLGRIDYLKVDAEGHDIAVLRGASGLIESGTVQFIQFEFGGCNIDSRTFLRDFIRLLEPRYRISRMLSDGLQLVDYSEHDEIFITSNFLAERR